MSILKRGDKGNSSSERLDRFCNVWSNCLDKSNLDKSSITNIPVKFKRSTISIILLATIFVTIVIFTGIGTNAVINLAYGQNLDAQQYSSYIPDTDSEQTVYTYYIDPSVTLLDNMPIIAVHKAFESWESLNPSLNFIHVEHRAADILVKWDRFIQDEHLGLLSCGYINCELVISLGDRDCNNRYIQLDSDTLTNTIMYLIGRMLDIGHTNDQSHLMYGIKDPTPQQPFDDLGYSIPNALVDVEYYVGERSILDEIAELDIQLELFNERYDTLNMQIKSLDDKDRNMDIQLDLLYEKYNALQQEYVDILAEYDLTPKDIEQDHNIDDLITSRTKLLKQKIDHTDNEIETLIVEQNLIADKINPLIIKQNLIVDKIDELIARQNILIDVVNCFHGYDEIDTETPNDNETLVETSLEASSLDTDLETRYTYWIDSDIPVTNDTIPIVATYNAFAIWSKHNPLIKFEESYTRDANITITFYKYIPEEHAGLATCHDFNCNIKIFLGSVDCNGRYVQADLVSVTDTVMHEIGHALKLEHHSHESHLMYGLDRFTQIPFDDLGYTIPPRLSDSIYYVGQRSILDEIYDIDIQLELLSEKYDTLWQEYTDILAGYRLTPEDIERNPRVAYGTLVAKSEPVIYKINDTVDEINALIDKQNKLIDNAICFPGVE